MIRLFFVLLATAFAISACAPGNGPVAKNAYRIGPGDTGKIQFRMLDSVNSLRAAAGRTSVQLNPQLNAAAATHSRDMANQNRPWHFGSDGSSPVERVQRAGYTGGLVGEVISETFETEIETLGAWMEQPDTRRIIMTPEARNLGFSWYQERGGKIWWTLVMGD